MRKPTELEATAFRSAHAISEAIRQAHGDMVAAWPRGAELEWCDHDGTVRRGTVTGHRWRNRGGGQVMVRNRETWKTRAVYVRQIEQAAATPKAEG